ncbi:L,D-transpeptidase [Winogradskya humida]|uniref:L,D-TPase catalytic domain-containing protein n=1 Tax=Winogradskya humida TaxID=113566 RepID=A0ABQ4A2N4_9ACTN|nr:L,D-transpeptidase [Actinoplanes humidus]GIE25115.1 hypothetical protein Ahu01nite_082170 [Actinoplanes humidus]
MPDFPRARVAACGGLVAFVLIIGAGALAINRAAGRDGVMAQADPVVPPQAALVRTVPPLRAAPAPAGLPKIDYWGAAAGFPADRASTSVRMVLEGLSPHRNLVVYDAEGGRPRAVLPPKISGMPVVVPIVERANGWVGVLLPTLNRRVGWIPDGGWTPATLRDQLIMKLSTHRLTWLRDGAKQGEWKVATGTENTPTPLGRTFVLGRTGTDGAAYAQLDALVLGSIPENPGALAPSLRDGHTAIHAWYRPSALGRSTSNGCIRMSPAAQRTVLRQVKPGVVVHIIN